MGERPIEGIDIANRAQEILEDRQGSDIELYDVRERSNVTDYVIVVSGTSPPHLKAMNNELQAELKKDDAYSYRRSGDPDSGWLVLDYVDVVIHIFSAEAREFYGLEELLTQDPPEE